MENLIEELFEEFANTTKQRAGLLAVITGVFMTSEDEDTKRTMAVVLDQVFKDHPVGDDLEKRTRDYIKKYLVEKEEDPLVTSLLNRLFSQN